MHSVVVAAARAGAVKRPSEIHVLQARHQAFGAFSRPNYPQYLKLIQAGHSRASVKVNVTTKEKGGNCFGEVVDGDMLADFTMLASQENRARVALRLMNDDDKKGQASRFVANLKHEYGYGSSTMCLVYNATGSTLHHHPTDNNQLSSGGSLYREEYPKEIRNGQWAAFLHVHTTKGTTGSVAAVVYRARNSKGQERDILLAWYTDPLSLKQHNKAYCEIGAVDSSEEMTKKLLLRGNDHSITSTSCTSADGFEVDVQTEHGTSSPTFTAIIKLKKEAE